MAPREPVQTGAVSVARGRHKKQWRRRKARDTTSETVLAPAFAKWRGKKLAATGLV